MKLTPEEEKLIKELRENNKTSVYSLKKLEDYPPEEKIAKFDELYKLALSIWEEVEKKKFCNEDNRTWTWDAVMVLLNSGNSKDFWDAFRKISE